MICIGISASVSAVSPPPLIGFLLSLFPWHGVHWLYDSFSYKHIDDKGDVWSRSWKRNQEPLIGRPEQKNPISKVSTKSIRDGDSESKSEKSDLPNNRKTDHRKLFRIRTVIYMVTKFVFISAYVMAFVIHLLAVILSMPYLKDLQYYMLMTSFLATQCLNFFALLYIVIETCVKCSFAEKMPFLLKFLAPFCFSNACRAMIEIDPQLDKDMGNFKYAVTYLWLYWMVFMVIFFLNELTLGDFANE